MFGGFIAVFQGVEYQGCLTGPGRGLLCHGLLLLQTKKNLFKTPIPTNNIQKTD